MPKQPSPLQKYPWTRSTIPKMKRKTPIRMCPKARSLAILRYLLLLSAILQLPSSAVSSRRTRKIIICIKSVILNSENELGRDEGKTNNITQVCSWWKSILMRLHEEVTFRSIIDIRELMQQDSWKAQVGRMTKTLSFCRSESSSRPVA